MEKRYLSENYRHMLHGADYNPEQWRGQPDVLAEDMRLMKLAHCNVMSVGIFSWAVLEPEEGVYDFSFLDKTFEDIHANGGKVILATPSGARPAWLSQKYPEVLRTNADRTRNLHGFRHNHCYTSPIYREKVRQINEKLAQRYKDHPALLMWHISNEYGGECHCQLCAEAFRKWLREKYQTLDNLNAQWWMTFWSHTYTDWSQIQPPSPLGDTGVHGLNLDWKRFVTHQTTDFMNAEIAAVKKYTPDIPATTNFMLFFEGLNYRELAKHVDVISWDAYPSWKGDASDIATACHTALYHDTMRSLKRQPFMLMESTPSLTNWQPVNKLKRPGQHRLASLQAVAHGSDTVQYFQWRKSRGSSEKFHGAVVDHVGTENTRVFREVAQVGQCLEKLDAIVGTGTKSKVAILYDWENNWALQDAQGFQLEDKKILETIEKFYSPLWKRGINTDVIGTEDSFDGYDLLIAPMLYMVSRETEDKLEAYVRAGGTVLCTYMTGMINENDLCHLGGLPAGKLKSVFGIWNEEIDTLYPGETNRVIAGDACYDAVDYCESIHLQGAKALALYGSDFYKGQPAAAEHTYGSGRAYYIAFRDTGAYADALIEKLLQECAIASDFDGALPEGVTAHSRTDGENTFVFLQNVLNVPVSLQTRNVWTELLSGEPIQGSFTVQPYETLILQQKKNGYITLA